MWDQYIQFHLKFLNPKVYVGLAAHACFLICTLQRKQVGLKLSKDTKVVLYKVTCKAKMKKDIFFSQGFLSIWSKKIITQMAQRKKKVLV